MEENKLIRRLRAARVTQERIGEALGRSRTVGVQIMNGRRPLKANEIAPLEALLASLPATAAAEGASDDNYVAVEALPAFAGAGGGGIAGADALGTELVARRLIEGALRGRAEDFLLVPVRGDSMLPEFKHGDLVLIDRRDRSPELGAGPFALRVGDTYVLKNVERARRAFRVFSSNPKYKDELVEPDEAEVIGRPVWVGRLL